MMRAIESESVIRFRFEPAKALGAIIHLVDGLGGVDKVALTKLLYIADRDHFIEHGHPITGDALYALPKGPVSSDSLHLLDGEFSIDGHEADEYVAQDGHRLTVRMRPRVAPLGELESETLGRVLAQYGEAARNTWRLVDLTHQFPEYQEVYRPGTSTPIPYELIMRHYGGDRLFRHGRPVVSRTIAQHMASPFPRSDADL